MNWLRDASVEHLKIRHLRGALADCITSHTHYSAKREISVFHLYRWVGGYSREWDRARLHLMTVLFTKLVEKYLELDNPFLHSFFPPEKTLTHIRIPRTLCYGIVNNDSLNFWTFIVTNSFLVLFPPPVSTACFGTRYGGLKCNEEDVCCPRNKAIGFVRFY